MAELMIVINGVRYRREDAERLGLVKNAAEEAAKAAADEAAKAEAAKEVRDAGDTGAAGEPAGSGNPDGEADQRPKARTRAAKS